MPAINFKKEFADKVESGKKVQTIRALRKDGKNPKPGQPLYLYTGMRTKYCRKLGEGTCKSVEPITIDSYEIDLNCVNLSSRETWDLVEADGFGVGYLAEDAFFDFFRKTHGLPFWGLLIKWELKEVIGNIYDEATP